MNNRGRIITAVLTAAAVMSGAGVFPPVQMFPVFASSGSRPENTASPSDGQHDLDDAGSVVSSDGSGSVKYDEDGLLIDGAVSDDIEGEALPDSRLDGDEVSETRKVIEKAEDGSSFILEPEDETFDFANLIPTSADELLLEYLENAGQKEPAAALSGNELTAYRHVKEVLRDVAAGKEERAEAVIPLSALHIDDAWIPEAELDLSGPVCSFDDVQGEYTFDESILREASSEMKKRIGVDPERLFDALATTCPYYLYWSAKSMYCSGPSFKYRVVVENGEARTEFSYFKNDDADGGRLIYGFSVASLYSALDEEPSYVTDTGKIKAAVAGEELPVILDPELLMARPTGEQLPRIIAQPEDFFGRPGDKAFFSVEAEGENLNYRWQRSTDGGKNWRNCTSEGSNSPICSFEVQKGNIGWLYRCVVISGSGNVKSEPAAILQKGTVRILTQPENVYAMAGEKVRFTLEAEGENLSYRWQSSANGGSTWKNCSSEAADVPDYIFEVQETNIGWMYRCVVSDGSSSVISEPGTVFRTETEEYTVTFSVNGDTTLFSPVRVINGESYFSAEGWPGSLDGFNYLWYTEQGMSDETQVTEETIVSLTNDIVLYGRPSSEGTMDEGNIWWILDGTRLTFYGTGIIETAFKENRKIEKVIIEEGVSGIAAEAFQHCENLREVDIADTVAEIGDYAFSDCTDLTAVSLPQGMNKVSAGLFSGCTSLTEIILPNTVSQIGIGAFQGCTRLKSVKQNQ